MKAGGGKENYSGAWHSSRQDGPCGGRPAAARADGCEPLHAIPLLQPTAWLQPNSGKHNVPWKSRVQQCCPEGRAQGVIFRAQARGASPTRRSRQRSSRFTSDKPRITNTSLGNDQMDLWMPESQFRCRRTTESDHWTVGWMIQPCFTAVRYHVTVNHWIQCIIAC